MTGTSASQAGLEVNDETELRPIPAKRGVVTMATESTTEEAMKASDVRFSWVEGGGADEDGSYHWCVDCPSLLMSLWYGGRLVSSVAPPSGAADTADAREILERYLQGPAWDAGDVSEAAAADRERGLCILCRLHYPRAVASPCPPDMELCEKCGCGREMHARFRSPYDRGCGMTWLEIFGIDADGEPTEWGLLHCCCDGYAPAAGGRPLTPSDFAADGSSGAAIEMVASRELKNSSSATPTRSS